MVSINIRAIESDSPCDFIEDNKDLMESITDMSNEMYRELAFAIDESKDNIDMTSDISEGSRASIDVRNIDTKGKYLFHTHPGPGAKQRLSPADIQTALWDQIGAKSTCYVAQDYIKHNGSRVMGLSYSCFTPDRHMGDEESVEQASRIKHKRHKERIQILQELGEHCEGQMKL